MLKGADLSAAYASADIFMMPSETETLGFVALEAMASGLPVVAVAAGGLTDIITHPGVTSQSSSSSPLTFPLLHIPIPQPLSLPPPFPPPFPLPPFPSLHPHPTFPALISPPSPCPLPPPLSLPPFPSPLSPSPLPPNAHPTFPCPHPHLPFPPPHPHPPAPLPLPLLLDPTLSSSACALASLMFASLPLLSSVHIDLNQHVHPETICTCTAVLDGLLSRECWCYTCICYIRSNH